MITSRERRSRSVTRAGRSVSWGARVVTLALVAALILPMLLIGPTAIVKAKAQPALLALAAEQPQAKVRVIAQQAGDADMQALVERMGGRYLKDLSIIDAFAAQMSASTAKTLAANPDVAWVSLDGPVEASGKPPKDDGTTTVPDETLRDEFNTAGYANNDGRQNWIGDWQEVGDDGLVDTGGIRVQDRVDCSNPNCLLLRPTSSQGAMLDGYIWREADLGTASRATLTYDFASMQFAGGGQVAAEISADGGESWVTLRTYDLTTFVKSSESIDITAYMAVNTRIRFRISEISAYNARIGLDNIEISYSTAASSGEPANTYLETLGIHQVWDMGYDGSGIGVAIIDSGITNDADFNAIGARMSFSANSNSVNDVYGHGTHVAGIVAGDGTDSNGLYQGVAPGVEVFSLKISDEQGMAYESDAVDAMQWVLENKDTHNIRVINLSVNSIAESSYHDSPMNAAAEILWFNGVVVVASVGNRSDDWAYDTVNTAPANDPFLITVGASNEKGNDRRRDDYMALFSANDFTIDGHKKPDVVAPGKDIYSVLSRSSPWGAENPDRVAGSGQYFRLSGTSMAAPMVTGAVALLLQAEPELTPDQVKYRLMNTGDVVYGDLQSQDDEFAYMDVYALLTTPTMESANTGQTVSQLLTTGDDPVNSSVSWNSVSWNSVSWNSVSWNSVSWNSVSWNSVSWNSVSWTD